MVPNETVPEMSTTVPEVNTADLGASKPIKQAEPTQKEIREWRAANFTVKHSIVKACGHKIDLNHTPTEANCWDCWEALFSTNPEGVSQVHQMLLNGGTQSVIARFGKKFTKMFGRFLQKKLLTEYASREVQAASGIEGDILNVKKESEASLGIR